MTEAVAAGRRRPIARWLVPLAALVVVVGGVVGIVLAAGLGTQGAPPEPAAFVPPGAVNPATLYDVRQAEGEVLTLVRVDGTGSAIEATVPADTPIESLEESPLGEIAPGDALAVFGTGDLVRNFTIVRLVRFPGGAETVEGFPRSPLGFTGHEVRTDAEERPVLRGVVEEVTVTEAGALVSLAGPDGPIELDLFEGAPLLTLTETTAESLGDGDRIAVLGPDGTVPSAGAPILVLPDGAR